MTPPARLALVPALLAALGGCRLFTDTASLVLENRSPAAIVEVYLPPHDADWGESLLREPIPPGDSRVFWWIAPGTYDILVRDAEEGFDFWISEELAPWERHHISYPH